MAAMHFLPGTRGYKLGICFLAKQINNKAETQKTLLTLALIHNVLLFVYENPFGDRKPELKQLFSSVVLGLSSFFPALLSLACVFDLLRARWPCSTSRPHVCLPGTKKVEEYKAFCM